MIEIGVKGSRFVVAVAAAFVAAVSFGASGYHSCGHYRPTCHSVRVAHCHPHVRHFVRPYGHHHCYGYEYEYDPYYIPGVAVVSTPVVVEECVVKPDVQCCSALDAYQHHGIIGGTLRLVFGICFGDNHRPVASDKPVQVVAANDAKPQNRSSTDTLVKENGEADSRPLVQE